MVGNREDGHDGSGKPRCETIHNQHRRSYWHDYRQRGLYMVTMVIDGRKRLFGNIAGRANGRPGTDEAPHVMLSALGRCVLEEEVPKIHRYYPEVEVWRVAIMPDHIHLLLMVRETLRDGKHLGMVVRGFKTGCSRAWWRLQDEAALGGKAPSTTAGKEAPITAAGKEPQAQQQARKPQAQHWCPRHLPWERSSCAPCFSRRATTTASSTARECLRTSSGTCRRTLFVPASVKSAPS